MAKLETIEGIGPQIAERLRDAGVGSTDALLKKGASPSGRKAIVESTGLSPKQVLRFVNHADLMRINGVGGEYAELLEAAGVDTVKELAQRNPSNLHAKLAESNAEKKLVRQLASASQVENWVEQAGQLDRVVTH